MQAERQAVAQVPAALAVLLARRILNLQHPVVPEVRARLVPPVREAGRGLRARAEQNKPEALVAPAELEPLEAREVPVRPGHLVRRVRLVSTEQMA